jgi:uncharacterized protein YycO
MIQIGACRGIGFVSDGIKLLTYSVYSHILLLFTDDIEVEVHGAVHVIHGGNVIEAWKGGVRLAESMSTNHSKGTVVDIFKLKTPMRPEQEKRIASFLVSQLGKKYDYWNVARFIPVVRLLMPKPAPSIWTRTHVFCSELALEAFSDGGIKLLERCPYHEVPPRDVPRSPLLMAERSVITT